VAERTVLVAHHDPDYVQQLVAHLSDQGFHVLGPARTARMALALAAQAPAGLAVVGRKLAGARDGATLARVLEERWGVASVLIDEPDVTSLELPA
jgi:DNA-binding response OmpR family regulator